MMPRMAAVVWKALVLLKLWFVCSVFSHSPTIIFTRDELLDIRQHTPDSKRILFIEINGCFGRWGTGPQTEKREACRCAG